MFNLFGNRKEKCPIPEDIRIWMEDAFIWLINQFGEEKVLSIKTLISSKESFPVEYKGDEKSALEVLSIIAKQMDVDPALIKLEFYKNPITQVYNAGHVLSSQYNEDDAIPSGIYEGKNSDGTFTIYIELNELRDIECLIAIFAHEIAHIKILGENRLKENDEYLTDLVTVFFGVGVFNANASFKFYADSQQWQYKKLGYFTQQEWGYALSLYAYVRNEESPGWISFLNPNIKSDFSKSYSYILQNKDKVLV